MVDPGGTSGPLYRLYSSLYWVSRSRILLMVLGFLMAALVSGLGLQETELFDFLNNEAYFCCDPGEEYYGAPGMARICTAVPPRELEKSLAAFLEAARARGLAAD